MTIVSFGRLVADRIRLEPAEACALVHQLWAQIARAGGGEGSMALTLPGLNAVGITAFGEVHVRRSADAGPGARRPHELAGDLGHVLLRLLHSGRATLASAGPACVAVARRATTSEPAADGAPRLESPSALLAELDRFRPPDPSSAIANVYARWMRTTDGGRLRPGGPQGT